MATNQADKAVRTSRKCSRSARGSPHLAGPDWPQRKNQTLLVLVELLLGLAAKRPVLCVVEDAQWIDPSTQELVDLVAGQIERARVLLVLTHRPNTRGHSRQRERTEHHPSWAPRSRRDGTAGAARTDGPARGDAENHRRQRFHPAVRRGARAQRDRGRRERRAGFGELRRVSVGLLAGAGIAADSLAARLDRAPQARSVAQMAAVIGREFSYDTLVRISPLTGSELEFDARPP